MASAPCSESSTHCSLQKCMQINIFSNLTAQAQHAAHTENNGTANRAAELAAVEGVNSRYPD